LAENCNGKKYISSLPTSPPEAEFETVQKGKGHWARVPTAASDPPLEEPLLSKDLPVKEFDEAEEAELKETFLPDEVEKGVEEDVEMQDHAPPAPDADKEDSITDPNFVPTGSNSSTTEFADFVCLTRFVHRKAPNPEKTTQNPQFVPMEELIAIKPAGDN
jgi:hypothetical protein